VIGKRLGNMTANEANEVRFESVDEGGAILWVATRRDKLRPFLGRQRLRHYAQRIDGSESTYRFSEDGIRCDNVGEKFSFVHHDRASVSGPKSDGDRVGGVRGLCLQSHFLAAGRSVSSHRRLGFR